MSQQAVGEAERARGTRFASGAGAAAASGEVTADAVETADESAEAAGGRHRRLRAGRRAPGRRRREPRADRRERRRRRGRQRLARSWPTPPPPRSTPRRPATPPPPVPTPPAARPRPTRSTDAERTCTTRTSPFPPPGAGSSVFGWPISYDGTALHGWARQPGQRTVQGELEQALATVLRAPVDLTVAGRTDAGVHATGQVAHCDVPRALWEEQEHRLVRRLRGVLPPDIAVPAVTEAHRRLRRPVRRAGPALRLPAHRRTRPGRRRCAAPTPSAGRARWTPMRWPWPPGSCSASTTSPPSAAAARAPPRSARCWRSTSSATAT